MKEIAHIHNIPIDLKQLYNFTLHGNTQQFDV